MELVLSVLVRVIMLGGCGEEHLRLHLFPLLDANGLFNGGVSRWTRLAPAAEANEQEQDKQGHDDHSRH